MIAKTALLSTVSWDPCRRRREFTPPACSAGTRVQKQQSEPAGSGSHGSAQHLDRRSAILAASATLIWLQRAGAAKGDTTAVAAAADPPAAAPAAPPAPPPAAPAGPPATSKPTKTFNERDFVLEVPRGFREVKGEGASGGFGEGGRPQSTRERIAAITPLRAKFLSEDGKEQLTVIQRNGSELKQFLFQVQDIRQFGSLEEVAALLLPKEVQVLAQGSSTVEQEPRDTGTVLGVVQLPPQTFYRYTFKTRGQRAHLSIVVKAGKVYLVAGSSGEDIWPTASARLKAAVVSFRLV